MPSTKVRTGTGVMRRLSPRQSSVVYAAILLVNISLPWRCQGARLRVAGRQSSVLATQPNSLDFQLIPSKSDLPGIVGDAVVHQDGSLYVLSVSNRKNLTERDPPYLAKLTRSASIPQTLDLKFRGELQTEPGTRGDTVGAGALAYDSKETLYAILLSKPRDSLAGPVGNGFLDLFEADEQSFEGKKPVFSLELPSPPAEISFSDEATSVRASFSPTTPNVVYVAALLSNSENSQARAHVWKVNALSKSVLWMYTSSSQFGALQGFSFSVKSYEGDGDAILLVESGRRVTGTVNESAILFSSIGEAKGEVLRSAFLAPTSSDSYMTAADMGPGKVMYLSEAPGFVHALRWEVEQDGNFVLKKVWTSPRTTDQLVDLKVTGMRMNETVVFGAGVTRVLDTAEGSDVPGGTLPTIVENAIVVVYNSTRDEIYREEYRARPGMRQRFTTLEIVNRTRGDAVAVGYSEVVSSNSTKETLLSVAAFTLRAESNAAPEGSTGGNISTTNVTNNATEAESEKDAGASTNRAGLIGILVGIAGVASVGAILFIAYSRKRKQVGAQIQAHEEMRSAEREPEEVGPAGGALI